MPILVQIGPLVRPDKESKNKKAKKETYSGKLGFRPDHPRWRSDMWSCMPGGLREVYYKFQLSSKSVERFSRYGVVEICHFLYLRSVAYNSLYYRTSRKHFIYMTFKIPFGYRNTTADIYCIFTSNYTVFQQSLELEAQVRHVRIILIDMYIMQQLFYIPGCVDDQSWMTYVL